MLPALLPPDDTEPTDPVELATDPPAPLEIALPADAPAALLVGPSEVAEPDELLVLGADELEGPDASPPLTLDGPDEGPAEGDDPAELNDGPAVAPLWGPADEAVSDPPDAAPPELARAVLELLESTDDADGVADWDWPSLESDPVTLEPPSEANDWSSDPPAEPRDDKEEDEDDELDDELDEELWLLPLVSAFGQHGQSG